MERTAEELVERYRDDPDGLVNWLIGFAGGVGSTVERMRFLDELAKRWNDARPGNS